jgi:hypothetical protein
MKKLAPEQEEIAFGPEVAPGVRVALRRQGDEVRQVFSRSLKDGEPIPLGTEVAQVGDPSRECGHWRELTPLYKHGEPGKRAASDGPAQVATPAYRAGYDRIFGAKTPVGLA